MSRVTYKQDPIFSQRNDNGSFQWNNLPTDEYLVTGVDRNGKRFRIKTSNFNHMQGINVWRGTKWLLRNGQRHRIQTVTN